MPRVFISYRRNDTGFVASLLAEKIAARFGEKSVFLDIDAIPLGADFRARIDDAIGQCDAMLVLIGHNWHSAQDDHGGRRLDDENDFVRLEIQAALRRDIPVIPVLVDGTHMPAEAELPEPLHPLSYRNAASVRPGQDLKAQIDTLIGGIANLPPRPQRPEPAPSRLGPAPRETPSPSAPRTAEPAAPPAMRPSRGILQRLLLLYRPQSFLARGLHILFYAVFAINSLIALIIFSMRDYTLGTRVFTSLLFYAPLYLLIWTPAVLLESLAARKRQA